MSQMGAARPCEAGGWEWPAVVGDGRAGPAWSMDLERQRAAHLTALYAVEVATTLSQLPPLDRWDYVEQHRADWDARAELPATGFLVALADRIPGARTDETSRAASTVRCAGDHRTSASRRSTHDATAGAA